MPDVPFCPWCSFLCLVFGLVFLFVPGSPGSRFSVWSTIVFFEIQLKFAIASFHSQNDKINIKHIKHRNLLKHMVWPCLFLCLPGVAVFVACVAVFVPCLFVAVFVLSPGSRACSCSAPAPAPRLLLLRACPCSAPATAPHLNLKQN